MALVRTGFLECKISCCSAEHPLICRIRRAWCEVIAAKAKGLRTPDGRKSMAPTFAAVLVLMDEEVHFAGDAVVSLVSRL